MCDEKETKLPNLALSIHPKMKEGIIFGYKALANWVAKVIHFGIL
jgi:hypothetical protein